ncbi:16S rRNA (guanine(966)-N(2))-methyltransferase RsmD [Candidatus Dojkabacteria bacterium]|nr:16S rRNA (guanine(966)-N(2))-methyltransferase RsmD [Candidatus Dojkabacteria bacterium]
MIRVITGSAKGKLLRVPAGTRPLTDRIKTSLFDSIKDFIPGANILDLFAGSGAFGIESLSRGAKYAEFVEIEYEAVKILKENLKNTKFSEKSKVIKMNVMSYLKTTEQKNFFDLIFFDPPFAKVYKADLSLIQYLLVKKGIVVFHHPKNYRSPEEIGKLIKIAQKDYGENIISVYNLLVN